MGDNMQEIKQRLNDLLDICVIRIQKAEEEKASYISQKTSLDSVQIRNDAKENELLLREEKCKEIEALGLSHDSIQSRHEQLDGAKVQLTLDRQKLEAEIKDKEKSLAEREGTLKLLTEKVNLEREQLEKDRKEYRVKVMEAIDADQRARGRMV